MNKEVVFISGASRGIGTAIAESFAQLGHTVIGTSRSEFKFESKLDNPIVSKSVQFLGNNRYLNSFFTKMADKGLMM